MDFHLYLDPQFLYATGHNQTEHEAFYSAYSTIADTFGLADSTHLPHLYNTNARGMLPEDFNDNYDGLGWCVELSSTAPSQSKIEGTLANHVKSILLTYNSLYGGAYTPPADPPETPPETPPVTGSVTNDWMIFALLSLLTVMCALLTLRGMPFLNFVFGMLTLGVVTYTASVGLMIGGWMQIVAVVMGVLTMIMGAVKLRG